MAALVTKVLVFQLYGVYIPHIMISLIGDNTTAPLDKYICGRHGNNYTIIHDCNVCMYLTLITPYPLVCVYF